MPNPDLSIYGDLANLYKENQESYARGQAIGFNARTKENEYKKFDQDYQQTEIQNLLKNISDRMKNETDEIKLKALKKQADFIMWDNSHDMPMKNGLPDINTYLKQATEAGYGAYARETIDNANKSYKNSLDTQKQLLSDTKTLLQQTAMGLQGATPEQKAETAATLEKSILDRTGTDVKSIFGNNWVDTLVTGSQTPEQLRTAAQNYDTQDGRDPNSQKSINLRNTLNNMGANIPSSVSAFELYNNPIYKATIDQLPVSERTAALSSSIESGLNKQNLQKLFVRVEESAGKYIKPGEKIFATLSRLVNTPEQAQLQALVDDLKAQGINIDETTDLSGVRQQLMQRIGQAKTKQETGAAVSQSKTFGEAKENPATQRGNVQYKITNKEDPTDTRVIGQREYELLKRHKAANLYTVEAQ